MKVIETIKEMNDDGFYSDFVNCHEDVFIKDVCAGIHNYIGSMIVIDLTNAMRKGKTCVSYSFRVSAYQQGAAISNYLHSFGFDFRAIIEHFNAVDFPVNKWGGFECVKVGEGDCIEVYKRENKAVRVFSPFAFDALSPLKSIPAKWTLSHLYRLIVNGQYEGLSCDGKYTDDYAYDAAINFGIGEINSGLAFIRRIMESPSGWRV